MQVQIQDDLEKAYYFLYDGKKYPFNIDLFNISSDYFNKFPEKKSKNQNINLVDEPMEVYIPLSDESIQNFVDYTQHKQISINNANVISLNYLSKKYEINSLIKSTDRYMKDHHDELILELLSINQNKKSFELQIYEDIIIEHLDEYINKELMLTLNIPILYRILHEFNNKEKTEKQQKLTNEIIEFLFKCLFKNGRKASILFSLVDSIYFTPTQVNSLFNEYSNIFDFHFINSNFLKTIYDIQIETIKHEEQIKFEQAQTKQKFEKEFCQIKQTIKEIKDDQKQKEEEIKKKLEEETNQLKQEIQQIKETQKQKEEEIKKKFEEETNQLKQEIKEMKENQKKKEEEIKKKFEEETNQLKQEIKEIKENQKKKEEETQNQFEKIKKEIDELKELQSHYLNKEETINAIRTQINQSVDFSCLFTNLQVFNKKDVETQKNILTYNQTLNKNDNIEKVINILTYLQTIDNNTRGIYLLYDNYFEDDKIEINLDDKFSYSKVMISKEMTEILYEKGQLKSNEFMNNIPNFSEFYIEIKYPTILFEDIYKQVLEIKHLYIEKVKISIFIIKIDSYFNNNKEINHITIDSSVKSIGSLNENESGDEDKDKKENENEDKNECIFGECSALEHVTFPSSLKFIGRNSFLNCSSLTSISIPFLENKISITAFDHCSSLTRIITPFTVNSYPIANIDDYEITQLISKTLSISMKGKDKKTNKEVFIKSRPNYYETINNFLLGLNCTHINHPGIIKIEKIRYPLANKKKQTFQFQNGDEIDLSGYIIISEYMTNGNLFKNTEVYMKSSGLNDTKKMNPTIRSKIIFGIAATMKYLHKRKIIHGNLIDECIFLDSKLEPKIGSFIFSRYTEDIFELNPPCGTIFFMAPELLGDTYSSHSFSIDVYSYAIILYRMFCINVFSNNGIARTQYCYMQKIIKGARLPKPSNIPDHYWELIQKCWDQDPKKRPTFSEITSLLRSDDKYALEEFGMKTNIDELHEYQKRIDI